MKGVRRNLVGLVAAGAMALGLGATAKAQDWYEYNGHFYTLTPIEMFWTEAEEYATSLGLDAHLVTINDQAEQDFIKSTFPGQHWIGFYQIPGSAEPDQGWVWISGQPVTYTNWGQGEPNNYGDENHARLDHLGDTWIDVPYTASEYGLIESSSLDPPPFDNKWHRRGKHIYRLTPFAMDWTDAELYARSEGGHLVTVNNANEEAWLLDTFGSEHWIGLYQPEIRVEEPDGGWEWISGEPLTYTNWLPGEPDNAGYLEHWARMNQLPEYGWDDVDNPPSQTQLRRGIVEKEVGGIAPIDEVPLTSRDVAKDSLVAIIASAVGFGALRRRK